MNKSDLHLANAAELRQLIERSVMHSEQGAAATYNIAGISPEQHALVRHLIPKEQTQAAVLMPIVERAHGLQLLFTQRAAHMRKHPGQISFPGGRIEHNDEDTLHAALRETEEEIGLSRAYIEPVGFLTPHLIFTGYCVTPVVAFVKPGFELRIDSSEVAAVFEAPLNYFLDPVNQQSRERQLGAITASVYDFPYEGHRIWGATAGIIMSLYRSLQAQSLQAQQELQ